MTESSLQLPSTHSDAHEQNGHSPTTLPQLQHVIEHAAHFLPAQGPITVFVHHNTLHAFEELPFHDAVKKASRLFGNQPYLSEERYRQKLARQRIRSADLEAVLREDLGSAADEAVLSFGTRLDLRLAMLQYSLLQGPEAELHWFVAETAALRRYRPDAPPAVRERFLEETRHWVMRDVRAGRDASRDVRHTKRPHEALADLLQDFGEASMEHWSDATWEAFSLQALWRCCSEGVHHVKAAHTPGLAVTRHRDLLLEATGEDVDLLVDDVLIRFCAAFLDQGFSTWALPHRNEGFFRSFCTIYKQPAGPVDRWMHGLAKELIRLEQAGTTPLESVLESLELLGVAEHEWEGFITASLLALRGWAGMIRQMEIRADRVAVPAPPESLTGYLAVRLVLERLALQYLAREALHYEGPLHRLREAARAKIHKPQGPVAEQRAFCVFQLAQVMGWTPPALYRLSKHDWATLLSEIETFNGLERRRVFHMAYERRYRTQVLDALAIHANKPPVRVANPQFQTICCIDDREESLIRHLEELEPNVECFSVAGFFSVAMYYRGAAEAHFIPQCPIVVRPQHWVVEDVVYTLEEVHRRRARARRALGAASHQFHVGSRTFTGGAVLAAFLGVLASIPLVARVLFPRLTAQIRRMVGRLVQPPPITQLRLERERDTPGAEDGHIGFSTEEMANIGERVLRDIGLTSGFARLVFFLGHGSSSLNNPHNSAYNCGACAGSAGAPNARAIAQILNDVRVRELLAERALIIPKETVFVGGYHNTCDDSVTYFDLARLPKSHQAEFEKAHELIEEACDRNAHERCRRFQSAPLDLSFSAARRHVEERAEDLSQTRPECGHATNAICVVGRRSRTRGLFMDRRAFLNSYDPTQDDDECTILMRTLAAAVPVCAGINLEYYFSYVDSPGWGCGTKLPHNVASLLGVMNGAASDLRTGLPWQMVEIHEPVRLLFVIETTPEAMTRIMDRNETIGRLCRNDWVQLAVLDPHSSRIHVFHNNRFELYRPETSELPQVTTWVDWYRGWRDHLGFAQLVPPIPSECPPRWCAGRVSQKPPLSPTQERNHV